MPVGGSLHRHDDEGYLADTESISDTLLAYEGGVGKKYVKGKKRKRMVPKWFDQYVWNSD